MPAGPIHMAERRGAVMDAAEKLIRKTGSTDFTMAELARAAGVSRATTFNLFESKLAVLYALLNRSLDGVEVIGVRTSREPDGFVRIKRSAQDVSRFLTEDARFYRALYRVLLGAADPEHRPAYMDRAMSFWRLAITGVEAEGLFDADISADQMALEMLTFYLGLVDLWVHGELGNQDFIARSAYGTLMLTLGLTRGKSQAHVKLLMRECRPRVRETFTFRATTPPVQSVQERRVRTGKGRASPT